MREQADTESPDKRKQPEVMRLLERYRPSVILLIFVECEIVGGEGVVKIANSSDIP